MGRASGRFAQLVILAICVGRTERTRNNRERGKCVLGRRCK